MCPANGSMGSASPRKRSAVRASIYSQMSDEVLIVHPERCFMGAEVGCDDNSQSLGSIDGTAPVYAGSRAGEWQCIEMHVRVDESNDGVIELLVDGSLDAMRDDLGFVQGWDDNRWNSLQITGSWDGGPPESLRRWIDDVVISRAPIGCG